MELAAPFPCTPNPRQTRLRFAPTAVHLRSGTLFGLPAESTLTFTGISSSSWNWI